MHDPNTSLLNTSGIAGGELHKFSGGGDTSGNNVPQDSNNEHKEINIDSEEVNNEIINETSISKIVESIDPENINNITDLAPDDLAEGVSNFSQLNEPITGGGFISFTKSKINAETINKYLKCTNCIYENDMLLFNELSGSVKFIDNISNDDIDRLFKIFMAQDEFIETIGDLFIKKSKEKLKKI